MPIKTRMNQPPSSGRAQTRSRSQRRHCRFSPALGAHRQAGPLGSRAHRYRRPWPLKSPDLTCCHLRAAQPQDTASSPRYGATGHRAAGAQPASAGRGGGPRAACGAVPAFRPWLAGQGSRGAVGLPALAVVASPGGVGGLRAVGSPLRRSLGGCQQPRSGPCRDRRGAWSARAAGAPRASRGNRRQANQDPDDKAGCAQQTSRLAAAFRGSWCDRRVWGNDRRTVGIVDRGLRISLVAIAAQSADQRWRSGGVAQQAGQHPRVSASAAICAPYRREARLDDIARAALLKPAIEAWPQGASPRRGQGRWLKADLADQARHTVALEVRLAGEQLKSDEPIAQTSCRYAGRPLPARPWLLGRQVHRRAEDGAALGLPWPRVRPCHDRSSARCQVEELHDQPWSLRRCRNRFSGFRSRCTMPAVCFVESPRRLTQQPHRLFRRERPALLQQPIGSQPFKSSITRNSAPCSSGETSASVMRTTCSLLISAGRASRA